jgi:single-strand DNA-binding protein
MNDILMTLTGNVCDEPTLRITKNGISVAKLRVASTPRHFDRAKDSWVDNETIFLDVTCWRGLADHVVDSVHKGQPVVVTGRFTAHTYEVNEQLRYGFGLDASAIGHDLSRGTAVFSKANRATAPGYVPADENGVPVDDSDRWFAGAGNDSGTEAGAMPVSGGQELAAVG